MKLIMIIEIVKYLGDSGLLLKGVTKTVQNEVKEQKGGFRSVLLCTLGASLLGDLLIGKGAIAKSVSEKTKLTSQGRGIYIAGKSKGKGKTINRAGEGVLRAGYGNSNSKMDF